MRAEHEQLDLDIGTHMLIGDESEHIATGQPLHLLDELVLHRVLKGASGFLHDGRALQLDHRHLDLCVDTAQNTCEEIPTEHHRLGSHRLAVVVALVQSDHCKGDS